MIKTIRFNGKKIGSKEPCFLIAEAGVNHNGKIELALKLIQAAAEAGADAVKFQTFKAGQVTTKDSPSAAYQKANVGETNQWRLLRELELKENAYPRLIKACEQNGVLFMSTPHGHIDSVKVLNPLVKLWKVGSGDLTNLPLLDYLGRTKKPIILSTGMATIKEIKEAVSAIKATGNMDIIILQCTTSYPCPPEEANVAAMLDIQKHFPSCPVGYSDHTMGVEASVLAASLGALVIEKHFTLNRNLPGPDQKNSLEPAELKTMINQIRQKKRVNQKKAKLYLGSKIKKPTASEIKLVGLVRKSVIASQDIAKGTVISEKMLTIKRPARGGVHPREYWNILGKTAKRDIKADTQLKSTDY